MRVLAAAWYAAVAVLFWYAVNGMIGDGAIDFVRGLGWPVSTAWLVAVPGAIVGALNRSWGRDKLARHAEEASATTARLALTYTPFVARPAAALPCFEKWAHGADGTAGEVGGVRVSVFDMTERIPSDDGDVFPVRTIVLLPAAGLPAFTTTPRWAGRFAHAFGFGGMTFDPAATPAGVADVVRRFSRKVRVAMPGNPGPWTPPTPEAQAAEDAARRLFAPTLMEALLGHPGWSVQAGDGWLACWRGSEVRPAGERPELIATALALRAALLAAAADPSPLVLPPRRMPTRGQYMARASGMVFGSILGMFGGFFGLGEVAFGMGEHTGRALVPFVGAAIGALLGGILGFAVGMLAGRLPVVARWVPTPEDTPEQKAAARRRAPWVRGCGCLGFLVGFPAGFAAFMALLDFGLEGNPRGGWLALFPTLTFGGAFAGMIGGCAVGSWIARRRGRVIP